MEKYSNIAKSARGQAGHDLWEELTQTPESVDPLTTVYSVVDFVVTGMMHFADLAGYIDLNNLEFSALCDYSAASFEPSHGLTPTAFLRLIVRADLTTYLVKEVLPRHLATRAERFVWNEAAHSWFTKEYMEAQEQ